ncbi:hypothetical protein D3C71_1865060 [compost metagenome]
MRVAKSPAVGAWAPMTLHSVAIGCACEVGCVGADIGSLRSSLGKTLLARHFRCPCPVDRVWRIRQENWSFDLLIRRFSQGRWAAGNVAKVLE